MNQTTLAANCVGRAGRTLKRAAKLAAVLGAGLVVGAQLQRAPLEAALVTGDGNVPHVLFGLDDDNLANALIQPPNTPANQSLNNADVLIGERANDVLVGLLGSDFLDGRGGDDVLVGGTEQGSQPNSDIMFGGPGNDVNIWAPGDGSEMFDGGPGRADALVLGPIDKVNNVPTLSAAVPGFPFGVPTANLTGSGGFCTIEPADPASGYRFLVRFFGRATGALAVTVRVINVEQVFCTSQAGGEITFADLRQPSPSFATVQAGELGTLNPLVSYIVR